jgi:hypothetical protein
VHLGFRRIETVRVDSVKSDLVGFSSMDPGLIFGLAWKLLDSGSSGPKAGFAFYLLLQGEFKCHRQPMY